jgi:hypothetical protein
VDGDVKTYFAAPVAVKHALAAESPSSIEASANALAAARLQRALGAFI